MLFLAELVEKVILQWTKATVYQC